MSLGNHNKPSTPIEVIQDRSTQFRYPAWMPDGNSIIFSYRKINVESLHRFYDLAIIGGDGDHLRIFLPGAEGNYEYPRPSHNGKFLAFIAWNWRADANTIQGRLLLYDFSSEKIFKTVENAYFHQYPSWSFDSEQVLFLTSDETIAVYSLKTDAVTVLGVKANAAAFHPDGRIFFVENKEGPRTLLCMNSDGSGKKKVLRRPRLRWFSGKFPPFQQLSGFSKSGRHLLFECGTMILPGVRVKTIEVLDLENNQMVSIHSGVPLSGAAW